MAAIILASTEDMHHDEWLNWRKKGIGGSDASVVFGINKYKSPVELFMEKTDMLTPTEVGEAAYWGNQLESVVKAEFTKRTGIEVFPVNKILKSKEYPFMLANLDGVCKHPELGTCVFEAKTASAYKADEWDEAVPMEYILQVHHYMAVTGYAGAYIAVLIGGNTFKWTFLERDEDLISTIVQREADFWERVESDIPPSLDGSEASAKFLNKRFPTAISQSKVQLPESAAELITQYETARQKAERYTEQKQRAENLLKQMLGDSAAGVIGNKVIGWTNVSQERFDSKAFKSENSDLYKQYTNQSSHRRFTVKQAS